MFDGLISEILSNILNTTPPPSFIRKCKKKWLRKAGVALWYILLFIFLIGLLSVITLIIFLFLPDEIRKIVS